MKKFVLSTLACLIANQAFAATNTVSDTTATKKTTTTKTATTKAASASTAAATAKETTTDSKTAKKSQPAKSAASVTQSTTTPKLASATAVTAAKPTAAATAIPATTTALGIKEDATQTGIDSDYTSGAGVAGASSEEVNNTTTAAPTFDPTTVGNNKTATTPASFSTLNLSDYAQLVNSADWKPGQNVNSATTLKLQALLDWNHASPGPIDGGWGMNAKKALKNFQAMHGLPQDGRMSAEVWKLLNEKIPANQPVLVGYTLTQEDIKGPYQPTPSGSEAKSKMKGLYYQDVQEMLAERFHMDIRYLKKLNSDKKFTVGETITVFNPGAPLNEKITRLVAKKADNILYAYNGDRLIATYPTTVGSSDTPSPTGTFSIVNRVKNPWYRASSGEGKDKKVFMLPPGPKSPVGVVWMGLSKPSYGIHGSPVPEGISRQASHGCVRLTNWDVLEVYANVDTGTKVDLQ
ncbi:murein L,D-transpeptidase [Moraxella osloensis]|uniref:Murein L,D-transpeptidase n=1 Tax=Faucicola osloensis TaxID=34062 RepID=A0AAD0AI69_FAUOS|nr:L,D-transpeptidase family protein [Moraxella osloensis]ATQ83624.1 murein L,D-transpeptidase [Moraxella osloensis]ATW86117.1 murein L,D-transpeptidase [Moraxella osloensis]